MQVFGRLRPGVTAAQAQTGLQPWFKAMLNEDTRGVGFPRMTQERRTRFLASTLELTPAPNGFAPMRRRLSQPLWVLLAATAMLLGLACLNVAGLFLARGTARERELSTRLALGASRGRIGRQLLTDCVLLALGGGFAGVMLAPFAVRALIAFLPGDVGQNALQSHIDPRLLLFACLVSVSAGLLSGFTPSLQAGRESVIGSLRERGGTASGSIRLRKAVVTAQIAFTLILLIGGALFSRTLASLLAKGPGFMTFRLVSFGVDPVRNGYTRAEAGRLIRRIEDELRNSPNIESSAFASGELLTGASWNEAMTIRAHQRIVTDRDVHLLAISPEFFNTLGARILAGRDFELRDSLPTGESTNPRTAIINKAFADRYLGGRNPLGARICLGAGPDSKPDIEVVGVVADFSYRGIREEAEQAYFPMMEGAQFLGNFYVRVRGAPGAAFRSIRTIVHNADSALPITYIRTLDEQIGRALSTERMLAALSDGFAAVALLLALVGLYGVLSFVVTQRTREIGIRLALGATRWSALRLVLWDALIMTAVGVAMALPCVWALGRLVESQLYGVKPTDSVVITVAALIVCATSAGAALIPAHRAAVVDPIEALRFE
jgi:predicted permease